MAVAEQLGDRASGLHRHFAQLLHVRDAAIKLAEDLEIPFRTVDTEEYLDPNYAANPTNRCYFCKSELHDQLKTIVREEGWHWVLDGANASDLGDHRPGMDAARERNVRSPLLEVGITKADVREIARHLGLPVWDKPAMACLSSRVPHGTPITPELLRQIEAAEDVLVDLGFPNSGCVTTARSRVSRFPWMTSALDQHVAIVSGVRRRAITSSRWTWPASAAGSLNGASNGAVPDVVIPLEHCSEMIAYTSTCLRASPATSFSRLLIGRGLAIADLVGLVHKLAVPADRWDIAETVIRRVGNHAGPCARDGRGRPIAICPTSSPSSAPGGSAGGGPAPVTAVFTRPVAKPRPRSGIGNERRSLPRSGRAGYHHRCAGRLRRSPRWG
ncbi:MAG: ATP-dependent sacrificial sulfur transferase LarE [Caldilineaceae bacterium]